MQGFADLGRTPYGKVLLGKIALFVILLAIAAANRFIFLRRQTRLDQNQAQNQAHNQDQIRVRIQVQIRALTRTIAAEHVIALAIVALAAALNSLAPAD